MFHKAPNVGDGAFRRLAQKVDLELLARLARADCLGRTGAFDCSAMDWFLERARALGVEHQPPAPLLLGRHVLELGVASRSARGRDSEAGLREAARWRDHGRWRRRSRRRGYAARAAVDAETVMRRTAEFGITALCNSRTPPDPHCRPRRSRHSLPSIDPRASAPATAAAPLGSATRLASLNNHRTAALI